MVGALTALTGILLLKAQFPDLPGWLLMVAGIVVAIPTCIVTSLIIERVAYRPLRGAPRLAPLITAIGVSIVLQTVAMLVWGRNYMTFPSLLPSDPIQLIGATVTVTKLVVIGLSALIMIGLMVLVNRSKLGRAMRATAENPRVAGLMGVAPDMPGLMVVFGGLLIAIPACMALAFGIEKIAYRPLRKAPRLAPLITAIGVSIILQNLAMLVWGRQYVSFPPILPRGQHEILGAHITDLQIFIVVLSFSLMAGLWLLVERTRLGRAMRATAQSKEVAELMGVNVDRVISATFVIGAAIAAIAGVMVSAYYGLAHYYMGFMLGLKAFSAAVLGGIGNIAGAMLGGLLLGVIEALGAGYIGDITGGFLGSHYQDVFAFFVLILVLVFRPSGLLGERVASRA